MSVRRWLLLFLVSGAQSALAQADRPPHPPAAFEKTQAWPWREAVMDERLTWHAERRRLHEAWRAMPPEERRRLRRDIQEAGDQLYPRRGGHHPPRRPDWPQE